LPSGRKPIHRLGLAGRPWTRDRELAQASLAVSVAEQGRRQEAKTFAADICHAKKPVPARALLEIAKLCD